MMRKVGKRYVPYFNRRYDRPGTLWEGRFKSCLVESARYVLACHRYIERNPVRAAMVADPGGYRWSSYAGNIGDAEDALLTPHVEFLSLGLDAATKRTAYRSLFERPEDPALTNAIRDATNGGYPLVGDVLKRQLVKQARRTLAPRKPGPVRKAAGADGIALLPSKEIRS
jgi:putative transposase